MTSANEVEPSGEELAVGSTHASACGITDGEDITGESGPPASPDRLREHRRKAGMEYRPV